QLITTSLHVQDQTIQALPRGFAIQAGEQCNQRIMIDALFNAACLARAAVTPGHGMYSPIPQKLQQLGWLDCDGAGAVVPGHQRHRAGLFVAGPPTNARKWGVETFRPMFAATARESVDYALGLT